MKVLLVTPPMTQLNTPYPATGYLTAALRAAGVTVHQADASLEWFLRLATPSGIDRILAALERSPAAARRPPTVAHLLAHAAAVRSRVALVVRFLQGRAPALATRIAGRRFLPEGPRFGGLGPPGHEREYLDWAFGRISVTDRAKYFASLFLEDLADAIRDGIDPEFAFARYGERLAASQPSFEPLLDALAGPPLVTTDLLDEITLAIFERHRPDVVGMSLPFPGNVLGALRMARAIRAHAPATKIVWGGGYVNTELRELADARLFDFIDALTFDDGERPLLNLVEHFAGARPRSGLLRTVLRQGGALERCSSPEERDIPFKETATPTYADLPLGDYLSVIDVLNPMHRLWSDTGWNKLTVAHGCYWKKCAFCDLSLDYIGSYQPLAARRLVDRIEALSAETGSRGFHFVDEAAPPAALEAMAEEILRRDLAISWWGNIRFEKTFTPELCQLLARSGCIAVTGGLEVASNRLLALMEKGVTVEQVARVSHAFNAAGVLVHAYLMFGFPSQTAQETIDSLEMVRQLFLCGCLDSAFWHRFAATAHSPIGLRPERYGITLVPTPVPTFARNDLAFVDPTGCDHDLFAAGLAKAIFNYMLGVGLEEDVRSWFDHAVPRTTIPKRFIARALAKPDPAAPARLAVLDE